MTTVAAWTIGTQIASTAYSAYESHEAKKEAEEAAEEAEEEAAAEEQAEKDAADEAVETARKKAAMRYGLSKTVYSNPNEKSPTTQKKTLLGQ